MERVHAHSVPSVTSLWTQRSMLVAELSDPDPLAKDQDLMPLRALVRLVMRGALIPPNAVLIGSLLADYVVDGLEEFVGQEGIHYHQTSIDVWQGLRVDTPGKALLFRSFPSWITGEEFEQGIVDDSFAILCNYRGPDCLDDLLNGVDGTEVAIAERLLQVCDSILLTDNDGVVLRVFGKTESFSR